MPRSRRSRSPRRIPEGYELNPATNRLRKKCPPGKMRSPYGVNYCINIPRSPRRSPSQRIVPSGYEINPATNRLRKKCPVGKVRTPRGYCVLRRRPRSRATRSRRVPSGYEINPATGRKRKLCPPGKVRSPRGYCVKGSVARSRSRSPRRSRSPVRGSPKECCVCYENTKTGVQGCKHPVCKTCFKGMKRSGRTLACPMCRGNMRKLVKV
jgi:hypothetical protein